MKNKEDTITDSDINDVKIETPGRAERIAEREKLIERAIKRSWYRPNIEGQLEKAKKNATHPKKQTPHQEVMEEVTRNVRQAVRRIIKIRSNFGPD